MYRASGFVPPWIGYLAVDDGSIVGTCAFKCAPVNGRVEIAYFTFPEFEGRGIATAMARRLIAIAHAEQPGHRRHRADIAGTQCLEQQYSAALGFKLAGFAVDADVGKVWEWHCPREVECRFLQS